MNSIDPRRVGYPDDVPQLDNRSARSVTDPSRPASDTALWLSLLSEFAQLDFALGEYVIAGSGALYARGFSDVPRDLDVVARGSAWRRAVSLGTEEDAPRGGVRRVLLSGGRIEVLNGWFPQRWSVGELVANAELIDGFAFVALDVVTATKRMLNTAKDRRHLLLLSQAG